VHFLIKLFTSEDYEPIRERGKLAIPVAIFFWFAITGFICYIFIWIPFRSFRMLKAENDRDRELQPVPTAPADHLEF
jgi:hypothetical protein